MTSTKDLNQHVESSLREAVVISASRRHVLISADGHELLKGTCSSKALTDMTVGDRVLFSSSKPGEVFVESVLPRRNCISRSFSGKTRNLAANLDHLFIVAAVLPLFNTIFIDRIAAVAHSQNIPFTILVNKIDLGVESTARLIEVYTHLGFRVLLTSAKLGEGLDDLRNILSEPEFSIVAMAGISGVGKSTFVNQLIPGADRETAEVCEGRGSGRQTTSQSFGFLYERPEQNGVLIIDLPGIQSFGVSHLTKEQIVHSFSELIEYQKNCEYSDCAHVLETNCGVKKAVEEGKIADCRYQSYLHMLDELEQAKEY